jgi:transcriptional regulator with XRE-family HTH domain
MGEVLGFPSSDPVDAMVGARLHRWRTQRRIDLETLARAVALTPEEVRRIEAGRQHLTAIQMAAATSCLHLPLWALVSDVPAY